MIVCVDIARIDFFFFVFKPALSLSLSRSTAVIGGDE